MEREGIDVSTFQGRARWLTPVILALWEAEGSEWNLLWLPPLEVTREFRDQDQLRGGPKVWIHPDQARAGGCDLQKGKCTVAGMPLLCIRHQAVALKMKQGGFGGSWVESGDQVGEGTGNPACRGQAEAARAFSLNGIRGDYHHDWLILFCWGVFLVEMGFHHVGQAGLKLLTSSDPPVPASQSVGITSDQSSLPPVLPAPGPAASLRRRNIYWIALDQQQISQQREEGWTEKSPFPLRLERFL
ncbi:hypothetical protein AAY473_024415 [Plecturocebus cupreus]